VQVDMGAPRFDWREIPLARDVGDTGQVIIPGFEALGPASLLSMGNPHAVFFVPDANALDVEQLGAALEHHSLFPERANISFASGVSAVRAGRTGRAVTVTLPGGDLQISWREADGHVLMTGPVEREFSGTLSTAMLEEAA